MSFNTIKEGLKATKQHRQALARTARVSTSAYLRMAFDVLGLRACKLQHSSKAHWKRAKVKTRSHLKVKILPRKIAKHTPGFLQSMAQSSKDTIKPKIRNFKFYSDFLSFKQAFLSTNTSVFQYSVQISLALHVQKNTQHQPDLLRCWGLDGPQSFYFPLEISWHVTEIGHICEKFWWCFCITFCSLSPCSAQCNGKVGLYVQARGGQSLHQLLFHTHMGS